MEYTHLFVFAIFCLALVGIEASQSGEDYWHSVWPHTPLPKPLSDLLLPDIRTNAPIKGEEEKQYWTVFFEHDLYPGKKMILGFHKHFVIQHFGVHLWGEKSSQPFGRAAWGPHAIKTHEKASQSFGNAIETERHSLDDFCGNPSAIGEGKYCASSLESMMDFAISKLGKNIKPISSSFAQNQDQYVVEEVKKIGDKAVMCHRLNIEKVVFYCHHVNATITYMVPLVASYGTKAKAVTICHHDTRGMDPDVLYEVLNVKPGTIPICHFIGNKAVAWVPNRVMSEFCDHPCVI